MVETRHSTSLGSVSTEIRSVDYTPAAAGPFECFTLGDLHNRVGVSGLSGLERLRFELVIAPNRGRGLHEVDFETTAIDCNRWLHVRSGQVHRWIESDYDAELILLEPLLSSSHWRAGPRIIELDDDELHDIEPLLRLARQHRRTDVGSATLAALRDLIVRWLCLDRPDDGGADPLYAQFRLLLHRDVGRWRNVDRYARLLNCSTRTLARCCERAGAPSPKKLVDEAVLLEAQRRLALPESTIGQTASPLGFDELTNFTKFFKRLSGATPTAWQAEQQAYGSQDGIVGSTMGGLGHD